MCFFVAIGLKEEFVSLLSLIGEYWECKNDSILKISNKLKWNWITDFNEKCSCNLFSATKDKNNFIKMRTLVQKVYSCIVVSHFYSGNQNEERLNLVSVKTINADMFQNLILLDQDVPIKITL